MLRVYTDRILIPHAVEVDGQVIMLYDPVVHHKVEMRTKQSWTRAGSPASVRSSRWAANWCRACSNCAWTSPPAYTRRPFQMKANNGILLIDDFGRQVMSPRELLNRWIVPLDRRVDYLSLRYGVKFQIPFRDDGGLLDQPGSAGPGRRGVPAPHSEQNFRGRGGARDVRRDLPPRGGGAKSRLRGRASGDYFRELCIRLNNELRACYPADFCNIMQSVGEYESRPE